MTRELVGGLLAILIGGGYFAMALQIRASALADAVGPAGLPKALGLLMIFLGIVLSAQALLSGRRKASPRPAEPAPAVDADADDEIQRGDFAGIARAGGLLAIGIAYLLIVRTVGYVPAIAALIIAAALYGGAALSWRVFAIGIAGAVFYYALFVLVLGIPLPASHFISLF
jgi:putative tricarboxylic transport membrane protein